MKNIQGKVHSAPLESLVTISGGGTPSKRVADYFTGNIPWVTPKDMKSWYIDGAKDHITEKALAESSTKLIDPGAVIICIRSGVLAHTLPVAINRVSIALNQDMKAFRCCSRLYAPYLARFLKWYSPQLLRTVRGTTAHNLSMDVVKRIEVPLPPLSEQKRIADILDKADAIRRKRQEAAKAAAKLQIANFYRLFGDPASNNHGWKFLTVGEALKMGGIVEIQDGNHGNDHPKVAEYQTEGIPFVAANCLAQNRLNLVKCPRLSRERVDKLRIGFSRPRDVLLTHKATVGLTCVVPDDIDLVVLTPQVTYYRCDARVLNPYFLSAYFQTEFFQSELERRGKQSTRSYIGITRQRELPLVVPPISLQKSFEVFVKEIESTASRLELASSESALAFNSLVNFAFLGEL